MELKMWTSKVITVAVVMATGALVAIGYNMDIPYLSAVTVLIGALFIRWMRLRTDEVIYDERVIRINQRASATTIAIFTLGVTMVGWLMMTWGESVDPSFSLIGQVMVYLGCGLLLIRTILHYYYSWRLGGWNRGEQG